MSDYSTAGRKEKRNKDKFFVNVKFNIFECVIP